MDKESLVDFLTEQIRDIETGRNQYYDDTFSFPAHAAVEAFQKVLTYITVE